MKIICFLRELGLPIDSISQLLSEDDFGSVISLMLDQQETALKDEIEEREEKLQKLEELKASLKSVSEVSVESIGDIAYIMANKKELKKIHAVLLLVGIPFSILQWVSIILWITNRIWGLFMVWAIAAVPYGIWVSRWYFRKVSYICPQCHTVFKPNIKEALWARHTPATRKLTCPSCGHHGFCVEVARGETRDNA